MFNKTEYLPYLIWWVKKDWRGNYSVASGAKPNTTGHTVFRIYNVKTDEELCQKLNAKYQIYLTSNYYNKRNITQNETLHRSIGSVS